MTKIESVKIALELWDWLAQDGERRKQHWPRWERNGGDIKDCTHHCPLCEFAARTVGLAFFLVPNDCYPCPMFGRWKTRGGPVAANCEKGWTAWRRWMIAETHKAHQAAAADLATELRELLAELEAA